jgi:hypothetical protein
MRGRVVISVDSPLSMQPSRIPHSQSFHRPSPSLNVRFNDCSSIHPSGLQLGYRQRASMIPLQLGSLQPLFRAHELDLGLHALAAYGLMR